MTSNLETTRIRICLSYDGTDFFGWQKQPNQENTLQGVLERSLSKIYNEPIRVIGSGRTDRGVHAIKQWAHFDLPNTRDHSNLAYQLRRMTPDSMAIRSAEVCPEDFHAQISAISKCYRYRIQLGLQPSPFQRRFVWAPTRPLDMKKLQEMADLLLGEHDFSSFQSVGTKVSSTRRNIHISRWVLRKSGILEYQVKGSGFLKQMVRNLVGTMIKLEQFQQPEAEFLGILKACDRTLAAAPAPAQGLFLSSVQYPQELDNKCRKL